MSSVFRAGPQSFRAAAICTSFLLILLTLTGCGGTSRSATLGTTNSPTKQSGIVGKYMPEWSFCVPAMEDGTLTCEVGYTVTNPTDKLIQLSGLDIYALVDGKVYIANTDQGSDGVARVNETWNPGKQFKAGTYFDIPVGATIEKVFFASSPDLSSSQMTFDAGQKGVAE